MSSLHEAKTRVEPEQGIAFQNPFAAVDNGSIHRDTQPNPRLNVPSVRQPSRRRSSVESLFSDLSELNIMSNDYVVRPLMRTVSNASQYSATSNSGPRTWRQKLRELYYDNYGALLVLLSQVFASAMNVSATLLEKDGPHGKGMHPFQILFVRQSLTALCCTVWALTTKSIPDFPLGPPDRSIRLLLVSRGLFGFFGVFGLYFSLLYLPLSEATVLTFLAPILTCYICSKIMPGETFTRQQFTAGLVSFVGVIFIAQPGFLFSAAVPSAPSIPSGVADAGASIPLNSTTSASASEHGGSHPTPSQHLLAIAIAMLGVVGATGAMTSIRAIGTRAHAFISVNYFSIWSSIVSLIAILVIPGVSFRLPNNLVEWALLFVIGSCGFILQALLTMGLAYGGPSSGSKNGNNSDSHNPGLTIPSKLGVKTQAHDMQSATEGVYEGDIEMQAQPKNRFQPQPQPQSTLVRRRSSVSYTAAPHESSSSTSTNPQVSTTTRTSIDIKPKILTSMTTTTTAYRPGAQNPPEIRHIPSRKAPSGNRATAMVYCQMLFALAADKLIFGTTLSVWSWIGSGLILAGAVWVAAAKDSGAKKNANAPQSESVSVGTDRGLTTETADARTSTSAPIATEQRNVDITGGTTDIDSSSGQRSVPKTRLESKLRSGLGISLVDRGYRPDLRPSVATRAEERVGLLGPDDQHSEHDYETQDTTPPDPNR